jgi:hypothetical protein
MRPSERSRLIASWTAWLEADVAIGVGNAVRRHTGRTPSARSGIDPGPSMRTSRAAAAEDSGGRRGRDRGAPARQSGSMRRAGSRPSSADRRRGGELRAAAAPALLGPGSERHLESPLVSVRPSSAHRAELGSASASSSSTAARALRRPGCRWPFAFVPPPRPGPVPRPAGDCRQPAAPARIVASGPSPRSKTTSRKGRGAAGLGALGGAPGGASRPVALARLRPVAAAAARRRRRRRQARASSALEARRLRRSLRPPPPLRA